MGPTASAATGRIVALSLLLLALASCGGGHGDGSSSPSYQLGRDTIPLDAPSGEAGVAARGPSQRTTFLLSTANGVFPNGPSRNAAISHDQRTARYIAYESDASNIVAGDTNGQTDILLVFRAPPFGVNGTPWKAGGTELISKGVGGAPANGPSYRPSVDGDAHHAPHCVAFVSNASNLVPNDTNGKPDGFVYDTRTQQITRVTVDSAGRQANGSTYSVSLSGHCKRVAFTSDATNLALTQTTNPNWSTSRTTEATAGTRQVYVRILAGARDNAVFKGLTFLASAAEDGTAGNANSSEPYIARSGKAVVFTSTSTNLAAGDPGPTPDVYRRTIMRKFQRSGNGDGVQVLRGSVDLISATPEGRAGNGASRHATITDDIRYVAFETDASDLLPGDTNGVTDIARAHLHSDGKSTQEWVSKTTTGGIGNGPSHNPVISDAGSFILFDSDATNLRPSATHKLDPNGAKDVFLWNAPTRNVSLESRNAQNGYLSAPSQHPATSSRGNYVAFESADPLIDLPLSQQLFPQLVEQPGALDRSLLPQLSSPDIAAPYLPHAVTAAGFSQPPETASLAEVAAAAATAGQQVYVRYLGPQ
jgi:hypothetical protein